MNRLKNIHMLDETEYISDIISGHVQARLKIVNSRNHIGNRLALSKWGRQDSEDTIYLPRTISVNEQLSAILQIRAAGENGNIPQLAKFGSKLLASSSRFFLAYLVLHEVAHIRNNWAEDREMDCHLWAFGQLRQAG